MRRSFFIILLIILTSTTLVNAQKILTQAERAFKKREYITAIDLYTQTLEKTGNKLEIQDIYSKIGESYFAINKYEQAVRAFEKSYDEGNTDPTFYLKYGKALIQTGDYAGAKEFIDVCEELYPDDEEASQLKKICRFGMKNTEIREDLIINNMSDLNTPYADFGITKVEDRIYFTSSRLSKDSVNIYRLTGQAYTDFYETQYDSVHGTWKLPVRVKGEINTPFNDGTSAYDPTTNTLYFMQCNGASGRKKTCNIYYVIYNQLNDSWNSPTLLESIDEEYNSGHPALSSNYKDLYFVSDLPGGQGGKDIWKITRKDDQSWSEPENVGKRVNTFGDELFPFIYRDSLLYFSSNGHVGYGGLDIFYSEITGRGYGRPTVLQPPINSSADDFSIIVFEEDSGMFCSNRSGGVGDDDIYAFYKQRTKFTISGFIKDRENRAPISDAMVILSGSDASLDSTISDEKGKYEFSSVKKGTDYAVTVHKEGYLGDLQFVEPKADTIQNDTITELAFDLIEATDEEIKINDIYYDFGKWSLTEESKAELQKMVNILKVNPDIKIRINSHTDVQGDKEFNLELSNYRAQSVVNFLIEQGINPDRLSFKGWGESKPVIANATTEEEHKKNRRTTFQIVNINEIDLSYKPAEYKKLANKIIVNKSREKTAEQISIPEDREIVFKLQVYAGKRRMARSYRNELESQIGMYKISLLKSNDDLFRYVVGDFGSFEKAMEMQEKLKDNDINSFVIAFMNGIRITILEARQLSESNRNP